MINFASRRTMMVDTQVRPSDVTKFPIIEAMLTVERELFVPADRREAAYLGEHLDIGNGRALLDPRTFAKLLDALNLQPEELVLDIASGLGYSAAVISKLVSAVVAVEEEEPLATEAARLLNEAGFTNTLVVTEPLVAGAVRFAPYDAVLIEGGVETVPDTIVQVLRDGGRIGAIFMQGAVGVAQIGIKRQDKVTWRQVFNASAPLLNGYQTSKGFNL